MAGLRLRQCGVPSCGPRTVARVRPEFDANFDYSDRVQQARTLSSPRQLDHHAFPAASCCTRVVAGRRGCTTLGIWATPEFRLLHPRRLLRCAAPWPDTPTRIPHAPPSAVQMPSSAYLMPSRCSTPRWCASFWRPRGAFCTARLVDTQRCMQLLQARRPASLGDPFAT